MNLKKLLLLAFGAAFIGTLLSPLVSAVAFGTIINQTQLDVQDLDTYDFERTYKGITKNDSLLYATWNIKTLDVNGSNYIVVEKEVVISYSIKEYYNCRLGLISYNLDETPDTSKAYCLNRVKENILRRRNSFIEIERQRLKDLQTQTSYNNELNELILN